MKIKSFIKKALTIIGIFFLIIFIVCSLYMIVIYFEFLSNKDSIFTKIEKFSKALSKANETDISIRIEENKDKKSSYFLDRNKKIIAQYSPQKYKLIPLRRIPFFVSRGFLIIEDNRFYKHKGINIVRLSYGIFKNIITLGHAPGGSTISQQLAKILFTKQKKTIKRKAYELYCTFELEKRFTKNEILQIYLNSIYLGHGIYGVADASRFYFDKDASELTIAEASIFIGMNRAPERYSPIKYRENAKRIQKLVLNQFVKEGYLLKKEINMEISRFWKRFNQFGAIGNQSFWKTEINRSGYITEYIRQILEKEFSNEKITQGGLIVETSIDLERQILAEKIVKNQLKYIQNKIAKKIKTKKLTNYTEEDINNVEASFTSIDYKKGEILVLVGGSGYSFANQFNRAVYSFRPIGSAVKPFIYGVALSDGKIGGRNIHAFSKFKDEIAAYIINGKKYQPKNYYANHKYGNMVTLYDALKTSLNTVSVAVFNEMDKKKVAEFIRNAAFLYSNNEKKRVPQVLSLALGTCELSTLELATSYSVFCRNGKNMYPVIIKKVYDSKGNVYYDYTRKNNPYFNKILPAEHRDPVQLIRPEAAYEIVQMMRSVFEKGGTGTWPAYVTGFNVPAYAKSGTTQEYKDGWFVGFTDREVSASWVGLDNNKSILMPGASTAGVIWCEYNGRISSDIINPIPRPKNMKLLSICMETGLVAGKDCPVVKDFYFWKDGPLPEKCYIHGEESFLDFEEE